MNYSSDIMLEVVDLLDRIVSTVSIQIKQCAEQLASNELISNRENMDSFTLFRQHLAISGIREQQSLPQNLPSLNVKGFNLTNSTFIILSGCYVISLTKQLDEASTFEEYMSIIYIVLSSITLIICYINIVWTNPKLFALADNFEKIISNSKWLDPVHLRDFFFVKSSLNRFV